MTEIDRTLLDFFINLIDCIYSAHKIDSWQNRHTVKFYEELKTIREKELLEEK